MRRWVVGLLMGLALVCRILWSWLGIQLGMEFTVVL